MPERKVQLIVMALLMARGSSAVSAQVSDCQRRKDRRPARPDMKGEAAA